MKTFSLVLVSSLCSALLAVFIYRQVEEPRQVIIRESTPVRYTSLSDNEDLVGTNVSKEEGVVNRRMVVTPEDNFTVAAERVTPAVVNIRTSGSDFDWWGGNNYGGSSGSGVIISSDGYIVTNNHVIEDGNKVEVTLNDKRKYKAKIVGADSSTDLALLKIEAEEEFPFLAFGNSDDVRVGEWVLAVGNPFNLESTVTAGIVSAKGRSIDILDDVYKIESFIQTDAAVNPGNSGGALVNPDGELIGINTAIITRSGRYEGYSFAIPSNLAEKIVSDIRDFGIVQRGILGVNIEEVTDELARELDLDAVEGIYISRVNPNSGAADAKMKTGDVILKINGVKTRTIPELQEQVARFRPGNTVEVEYIRNGNVKKADVVLKNKSNSTSLVASRDEAVLEDLGIELRNLTNSEQSRLGTPGVIVKSIIRGSKIERTNMDPGFIITRINDKTIENVDDFIQLLSDTKGKVLLEGIYENYPGEWGYTFNW